MVFKQLNLSLLIIYSIWLNPIVIGGVQTLCYLLLYGIALIYICIHSNYIINNYFKKNRAKFIFHILWIIMALLLSFVIPSLHGTSDYSYINVVLAIFRKLIIVIFLFILTLKKHGRDALIEYFMLYYASASVLYIGSSILFIFFPLLRLFWQNFLQLDTFTLSLLNSYGYANRFGWAGFAGFRNTLDCTISLIFLIYLYASNGSKIRLKIPFFIFLAFICFLGNMFYGRSGVIASTICLIVGLTFYKKWTPKLILSFVVVIIIASTIISFMRALIPAIDDWYHWVVTPFYNLFTTGSFNNYSANRLLNEMIFMPDVRTLLFGDGRYIDAETGAYYMRTDAGFMRQILFWGVGYTTLMYLCCLDCLFSMKRDMVLKLMFFITFILFEIKGEVYYEFLPIFFTIALIDARVTVFRQR